MSALTPAWQPIAEGTTGALLHDPTGMNWGPKGACPVKVGVFPDGSVARSVALFLDSGCGAEVWLNPGAARWLGNRPVEAAVLAEQDAAVTSDADQ